MSDLVILIMILEIVAGTSFMLAFLTVDKVITNKRMKENQASWDEYSKNMTFEEKMGCYLDWCEQRKLEKGWDYYYFPKM